MNIGREESKSGVMEEELEELASAIGELRGISCAPYDHPSDS